MINLKEELLRYEPMLEIDDIEESINNTEMQDMLDMLSYILRQRAAASDYTNATNK